MTLAYQFFAAGDFDGVRYRMAVKRLMYFLQHFNATWQTRFSARANSATAEAFRATMMVAAISYGVEQDLRVRFRGRGFPIDDAVYASLTTEVGAYPADASRLVNLSVRSVAGAGDNTLAVGFAIGGRDTKQVLVRGVGPALAVFGVQGTLPEPRLRLFGGDGAALHENTGWAGSGFLGGAFERVGAFALGGASKDAAFLPTLSAGAYTVHVTTGGTDGVALVEAYDLDDLSGTARFTNLSARTGVGSGDAILIAGFAIKGTGVKRVLVRAVGPGMSQFGVGGVLTDPRLQLFSGTGMLQTNDDWGGGAALAATFAQVGAFALPAESKDAALVAMLPPGTYTAQVDSADGTRGIALVEVYEATP
jgi:hypothetical protein